MKKIILFILLAVVFTASFACEDNVKKEINILTPNGVEVAVGETLTLAIEVLPSTINQSVQWSSSDDSVATILDGVVSGVKKGSVSIYASLLDFPDIKDEVSITVTEGEAPVSYYYTSFGHVFHQSDFSSTGGSVDINGLTWTYSPFKFLGGATQGVQIGSKNNPQTELWTFSANFPGTVIIESYSFNVCNASSGSGTATVSIGNYSKSDEFAIQTNTEYLYEEQSIEGDSFTFSLIAVARAMYFHSLYFTVKVPSDLELDLSLDNIEVSPVIPGQNGIPSLNYQSVSVENYYSNIDFDGDNLFYDLRELTSEMTKTSYSDAKYMLQYTDEAIDNEGYLYGMWDGDLIVARWDSGGTWQREHVWACAQMQLTSESRPTESTKNHQSDLHNLRVCCGPANGYHGNKFFDKENTSTTMFPNIASGLSGNHEYKGDFRGDVARIFFYMYLRYEGLELVDDLINANNKSMGKLSALLEWHLADPVDAFETQRNNRIFGYQGNRNPFIDYPTLTDKIFA